MPQENKKRGRRMKRKHDEDEEHDQDPTGEESSKRQKATDEPANPNLTPLPGQDDSLNAAYPNPSLDRPFFGMLDAAEQENFKLADETLGNNDFESAEERELFLSEVHASAEGKELKIAQSQSCSRLMERLIQNSTAAQLKKLFQAFSGNFIHLISHRFASHCCEELFLRAAPAVTEEMRAAHPRSAVGKASQPEDEIYVSMENLFLHTLAELEGSIGYLLTDQFGSHALRVLLLVLSGEPLSSEASKHLLQSKRKEGVSNKGRPSSAIAGEDKSRAVPKSFSDSLERLIVESVAGLDTDKLRALATQPNGNPTLQLLLKLELTQFGKQRAKDETSIIRTLLPDDPITAESGSATFINGLVYDPVGSHLVEQIVQHAPGKMFKSLVKEFFKERSATFARNDIAGYVMCRVLERLSKDDLQDVHEMLIPAIPSLLEKNRTIVIRTLIERCAIRDVDTQAIAVQLDAALGDANGFELKKLLKYEYKPTLNGDTSDTPHDSVQSSGSEPPAISSRPSQPVKVHFNLLAQAMLRVPGPLSSLILDSLTETDPATLQRMAKDPIICHTIQAALTSRNGSIIMKRKLVQRFYGAIGDMALDPSASHVVDCIWEGTHGLAFIRERIAEELAENEAALRDSGHGRAVWKNWKMDIYKRRRGEWIKQSKVKASNDGFQSFAEIDAKEKGGGKEEEAAAAEGNNKTALELARERHVRKKTAQEKAAAGREKGAQVDRSRRPDMEGHVAGAASTTATTA
ncbi:Glutamate decarboxylase 2 [Friedmanniomyces endolithicus]|nr:Glutamate decarboxylase 2 [Friedmanniomyces endolithicus]KAK0299751.1 Glutamate decarboxylase 2 [Friedmanniomyces endolithicus]KAK1002704.1 Glutamate decarboxylase 2 [Friedmanniomyces endolithicus]